MIILQIVAFLFLIPFTCVLLILCNVSVSYWLFYVASFIIMLLYTSLWGILLQSSSFVLWAGVGLYLLYMARSIYLFKSSPLLEIAEDRGYPFLVGHFKLGSFWGGGKFLVLMSFLKWVKYLPEAVNREFKKETGLPYGLIELVDQISKGSKGAKIEIVNDGKEFSLEIK